MNYYTNSECPRLELYFERKTKRFFDSSFIELPSSAPNHKLSLSFSRAPFIRELCILILLAKLRGPHDEAPDEAIVFNETVDRLSWLKALGTAFVKESSRITFQECFGKVDFITAGRGSGHNHKTPKSERTSFGWAKYHPKKLRLHNVHVYLTEGFKKSSETSEATEADLEDLACCLENSKVKRGKRKWAKAVKDMILDLRRDKFGPKQSEANLKESPKIRSAFLWRNGATEGKYIYFKTFKQMLCKMVDDVQRWGKGGTWYYHGEGIGQHEHTDESKARSIIFRAIVEDVVRNSSRAFIITSVDERGAYSLMRSCFEALINNPLMRTGFDEFVKFYDHPMQHTITGVYFAPGAIKPVKGPRTAQPQRLFALKIPLFLTQTFTSENIFDNQCLYLNEPSPLLDACGRAIVKMVEKERHSINGYIQETILIYDKAARRN